jgi:hypothetical protein
MEKPESTYFCNKCGYLGPTSEHAGCNYFACTSLPQQWADQLETENARLREELACTIDILEQTRSQLAAAQTDAERYRFLRQPNIGRWNVYQWASESARFIRLDRNELDAAIDDAIAKEKS